jgi:hypothetical protein
VGWAEQAPFPTGEHGTTMHTDAYRRGAMTWVDSALDGHESAMCEAAGRPVRGVERAEATSGAGRHESARRIEGISTAMILARDQIGATHGRYQAA